jgi:fibronectin-binding autotransporter adhesin
LATLDPSKVSIIKDDAGRWILSGTNTYGGITTVNNGTLLINGDSSAVTNTWTVNVAGTLGGVGTIGGPVTVNGSLAPGASIGKLKIYGNLTLGAGSTNIFEVNGSTPTNDVVVRGGSVNYGGVLRIVPSGTFTLSQTFTLFSGAGATNPGNFASISASGATAFSFTNGVLRVVSTASVTPATLTNSVSGNTLSLSWPAGQGWRL